MKKQEFKEKLEEWLERSFERERTEISESKRAYQIGLQFGIRFALEHIDVVDEQDQDDTAQDDLLS